jgi:hypothetical protein
MSPLKYLVIFKNKNFVLLWVPLKPILNLKIIIILEYIFSPFMQVRPFCNCKHFTWCYKMAKLTKRPSKLTQFFIGSALGLLVLHRFKIIRSVSDFSFHDSTGRFVSTRTRSKFCRDRDKTFPVPASNYDRFSNRGYYFHFNDLQSDLAQNIG